MSGEQSGLLRGGQIKALTTAVTAGFGLLSSVVLARLLTEDDLGLFVLVLAVVQVGSMLADGGSGLAVTRYAASAGSAAVLRGSVRAGAVLRLICTVVTLGLGLALMPMLLTRLFHGSLPRNAYLWALIWIGFKSIFLYVPAVQRGRRRWGAEGILLVLEGLGLVLLYLAAGRAGVGPDGLPFLISLLYLGLAVAGSLWVLGSLRTDAGPYGSDDAPTGMGRMLRFGLPLLMNSSLFMALVWTDRILLGLHRSREELAYYYVAVGLSAAARLLFSIPEQVLYSHLAATTRADAPDLAEIHARIFRFFAVAALAVTVLGTLAGRVAIPLLYGGNYEISVWYFQLLLGVILVRIVSIPASLLLIVVYERTPETRNALLWAFLANLALNLVLIPRYGIMGAVLSSLAGFVLATGSLWISLWRVARLRPDGRTLGLILGVGTVWLASLMLERFGPAPAWSVWGVQGLMALGLLYEVRGGVRRILPVPRGGATS